MPLHLSGSAHQLRLPSTCTLFFNNAVQLHRLIPHHWHSGTLCFLPKHSKRSHSLKDLRPVTLLEPSGKALLGTLATHILSVVGDKLCSVPQFAYLPQRGCEDVLMRVICHCAMVRSRCPAHKHVIHQLAQGHTPGILDGTITINHPWSSYKPTYLSGGQGPHFFLGVCVQHLNRCKTSPFLFFLSFLRGGDKVAAWLSPTELHAVDQDMESDQLHVPPNCLSTLGHCF